MLFETLCSLSPGLDWDRKIGIIGKAVKLLSTRPDLSWFYPRFKAPPILLEKGGQAHKTDDRSPSPCVGW